MRLPATPLSERMDDDTDALRQRIVDSLGGYGELYPDLKQRIQTMTTSDDPFVQQYVADMAEAFKLRVRSEGILLAERFGLSPKETQVALYLADGGSIADYAQEHAVSEQTVRTQLKSIFGKTGVNRQSALAALIRPAPPSRRV